MIHAADLPPVVAVIVGLLAVAGAALAFIGSLGLVRLTRFYDRVHAPTLGATLGMGLVLTASVVLFSALATRPVVHEIVIAVCLTVTTPATFMLLVRAALHRDRAEGSDPTDQKEHTK